MTTRSLTHHESSRPRSQTKTQLGSIVRARPGLHTAALAAEIGVSESTAAYHLDRLARSGALVSQLVGRDRCWFAAVCGMCPVLRAAIPVLARPAVARVASAIDETPRRASDLARASGLSRGEARWATTTLAGTFLVERSRSGRTSIREGAEVCMDKAIRGETCGLWGRCKISHAWRAAEEQSALDARAPLTSSR